MFRIATSHCSLSRFRSIGVTMRRISISARTNHFEIMQNAAKQCALSTSSSDNPDYTGPEGRKWREIATKYAEERHGHLSAATKAFEANEKEKAKDLSEKGKEAGRNMTDANKKAAEVILQYRNGDKPDTYLDLHGLYLEEALSAFRARLSKLQASQVNNEIVFEVVPGAGNHSKEEAVIKPKLIEELKALKFPFVEKNAGTLLVTIPVGKEPITIPSSEKQNSQDKNKDESNTGGSPVTWMFLGSLVAAMAFVYINEVDVVALVEKVKEASGLNKKK